MDIQKDAKMEALLSIATETWRACSGVTSTAMSLPPIERSKIERQLKWLRRSVVNALSDADLELINLEGQDYALGSAATPLNIEDFSAEEPLQISQMVTPLIMSPNGVVRMASVILRRKE